MAIIKLTTYVTAPIERVFDLSRSIDAHQESAQGTSEKAVDGVTSGLINLNQEVTWEARHFGIKQRLSVKITELERPIYFQDVMIKGAFARMKHDHRFSYQDGVTVMEDLFDYAAPWGVIGKLVEGMVLTRYMRKFLVTRNLVIKRMAESEEWRRFLEG